MGLHQLSEELWEQRRLLEHQLYRLELVELLLRAGRHAWLAPATRELEAVQRELRHAELARAITADDVADLLGAPACSSLPVLAGHAPGPWDTVLLAHHEALTALTVALVTAAAANRRLISAVQRATRHHLLRLEREQLLGAAAGVVPAPLPPVPLPAPPPSAADLEALEQALGPASVPALLDQVALDLLGGDLPAAPHVGPAWSAPEPDADGLDVVDLRARYVVLAGAMRACDRVLQPSLQAFLAA